MKEMLMGMLGLILLSLIVTLGAFGYMFYNGDLGWENGEFGARNGDGTFTKAIPLTEGWSTVNKPTEEKIAQIDKEHKEYRSKKAMWLAAIGILSLVLGAKAGSSHFIIVGVCCLIGAFCFDYQMLFTAIFLYWIFVPLCILGICFALYSAFNK